MICYSTQSVFSSCFQPWEILNVWQVTLTKLKCSYIKFIGLPLQLTGHLNYTDFSIPDLKHLEIETSFKDVQLFNDLALFLFCIGNFNSIFIKTTHFHKNCNRDFDVWTAFSLSCYSKERRSVWSNKGNLSLRWHSETLFNSVNYRVSSSMLTAVIR